jgi:hypothetical protein
VAVIQVSLEIPEDILGRVMTGDLVRHGGVVRDHSGQLVTLLDDGVQEAAKTSSAQVLRNRKGILIGLGNVAVASGAA